MREIIIKLKGREDTFTNPSKAYVRTGLYCVELHFDDRIEVYKYPIMNIDNIMDTQLK